MKTLKNYVKGALIGMIAEYAFRVEFGYLQGFILSILIFSAIIEISSTFKE